MRSERPLVLMAVFNALDFDGRVQRSAEALAQIADVKVLALEGGHGFAPTGYELIAMPVRPGEFGTNRALHLRFLRYLLRVARRLRPDVVYGHDFFMAFPAWLAARLTGARLIYDAHELIIPGSLGFARVPLSERIWYTLERAVVGRADLVIAANAPRAAKMAEHYRLARTPTPVRNLTPAPVSQLDDAAVLARYPALRRRSQSECLCVYQGDVSLDRGLGTLLDAFGLLPADYRLLVIGGGPDLEKVRERSGQGGAAANIDVVGRVPRGDLFDMLRLCDAGVVTYSFSGYNNLYCAPNKVFEYAHGGIPIVATGQPTLVELVAESGIGCIAGEALQPPTPQQMADAIVRACTDRERHRGAFGPFLAANKWQFEAERLQRAVAGLLAGAGERVRAS
jgi:glycosyltransferase involved in cell wall biosynthesis